MSTALKEVFALQMGHFSHFGISLLCDVLPPSQPICIDVKHEQHILWEHFEEKTGNFDSLLLLKLATSASNGSKQTGHLKRDNTPWASDAEDICDSSVSPLSSFSDALARLVMLSVELMLLQS